MKGSTRHAEDEAIKARERAARSVTTVVPNLASMLQGEANQGPRMSVAGPDSKVSAMPGAVAVAAVAPPPPLTASIKSSMSRDEEDRMLKEREKQRAPRFAVVPNLADIVQDGPSTSHFTPVVQWQPKAEPIPAAAAVPVPLKSSQSAPVTGSILSKQEQDEITKQRERNARAAAVVPNLASRLDIGDKHQISGPEPPTTQRAVSAPVTATAPVIAPYSPSASASASVTSRTTAHSAEDRDNNIKLQEKRMRAANRLMMSNAERMSQQEKDILQKERERQSAQLSQTARRTVVAESMAGDGGYGDVDSRLSNAGSAQANSLAPSNSQDIVRARYEAATFAMSGIMPQDDQDQLLKEKQRQTTYKTSSEPQETANSIAVPATLYEGRSELQSPNAARAQNNAARRGIAPGALAVSDGIAQERNKAVLTPSIRDAAPEYVAPVSRPYEATVQGTDPMDSLEAQGSQPINPSEKPLDQPIPIESGVVVQPQILVAKVDESETPSRCKWYILGAVVVILIVAIAVGVTVGGGKSDETTTEGSSGPPTAAPVAETARLIALRESLVAEGVSSSEQLTDPTSAQYKALAWLSEDDTDTNIDDTLAVTQRYVLAVFYYSMNGPSWVDGSEWLQPSVNVCEWARITCLAGEITAIIALEPTNMDGTLPTELDALPSLVTLTIEKNAVRGFVGPLNRITELGLNDVQLGEIFRDIPSTILEMTNLQKLYLNTNNLIGTIPTEIGKLTALNIFDVSANGFTGTLPTQMYAMKNLTEASVFTNQFGGNVFKIIEGIPTLIRFFGSSNQFTGTITSGISALSNIQRLELRQNKISGSLPNSIFNLPSLGILDLSANGLTGTVSTAIAQLENLAEFFLSDNQISGTIPSEVGRMTRLRAFRTQNCRMTGVIPTEIASMTTSLEFFQVNNNNFQGPIPTELGNLRNLKALDLNDNFLTGLIPTQLGQLTLLSQLQLVNNELSGTLPSEICAITSLNSILLIGGFPRDGLSCGDCSKYFKT